MAACVFTRSVCKPRSSTIRIAFPSQSSLLHPSSLDGGGKGMLGLPLAQRLLLVLSVLCTPCHFHARLRLHEAASLAARRWGGSHPSCGFVAPCLKAWCLGLDFSLAGTNKEEGHWATFSQHTWPSMQWEGNPSTGVIMITVGCIAVTVPEREPFNKEGAA